MPESSRRQFISGRSLQSEIVHAADEAGKALLDGADSQHPQSSSMVALSTRAMACDFHVFLNSGPNSSVETWFASDALNAVHPLEDQMTVYRDTSDLISINEKAPTEPALVEARLFELLKKSAAIARATDGAYDPTSEPLVSLWRRHRDANSVPNAVEVETALSKTGIESLEFDDDACTIQYRKARLSLNLNGIGKGYALDRAAEVMADNQIENFMFHGGASSVLARGEHNRLGGWPVGIQNPLFPDERLATLLLRDQAMSTSGSGVQFFRHAGKRYGHILDPRTGWPVDHLLSVTVFAPSAAEADALSTAFFVMGLEKVRVFCQNRSDVGALLISPPTHGRMLEIVNLGFPDEDLFIGASESNRR
jgi:FAD:protein FMN transferase